MKVAGLVLIAHDILHVIFYIILKNKIKNGYFYNIYRLIYLEELIKVRLKLYEALRSYFYTNNSV